MRCFMRFSGDGARDARRGMYRKYGKTAAPTEKTVKNAAERRKNDGAKTAPRAHRKTPNYTEKDTT